MHILQNEKIYSNTAYEDTTLLRVKIVFGEVFLPEIIQHIFVGHFLFLHVQPLQIERDVINRVPSIQERTSQQ